MAPDASGAEGAALTPAQRRALEWLPADGSWTTTRAPRSMASALDSLNLYHRNLCEADWRRSKFGNAQWLMWRLTPAGRAWRLAHTPARPVGEVEGG